ncbi:MAG: DNA polymerase III subunit delta', partial [bacterium]|nr:DNA polymerase III subunit delta' [bacterium]
VLLHEGGNGVRNADVCDKLDVVARAVSFAWLQVAVKQVDELIRLLRRNIQKSLALDALVMQLREAT